MESVILGLTEGEIKTRTVATVAIIKPLSAEKIRELAKLRAIQVGHGAEIHTVA
jgi:hypothetical protein